MSAWNLGPEGSALWGSGSQGGRKPAHSHGGSCKFIKKCFQGLGLMLNQTMFQIQFKWECLVLNGDAALYLSGFLAWWPASELMARITEFGLWLL